MPFLSGLSFYYIYLYILSLAVPTFEEKPNMKLQTENATSPINFLCSFTALKKQREEEYTYSVNWYRNDDKISSQVLGNRTNSYLEEESFDILNYGDKVCALTSFINCSRNSNHSAQNYQGDSME